MLSRRSHIECRFFQLLGTLFLCATILSNGCVKEVSRELHKATGQVFVNGEPAKFMMVQLHSDKKSSTAGISKITTIADETGSFEFSDYTASGGVPPGIYHVTFFWPTGFSDNSEDRLQAEFSVAEDSQFTVVVNPGVNQFSPFRLVINSEKIIPAEYIP